MQLARLSWPGWWLYTKIVYPPKMVTYLRTNQAVSYSWLGVEHATVSHKSSVLSIRPPSHPKYRYSITECDFQHNRDRTKEIVIQPLTKIVPAMVSAPAPKRKCWVWTLVHIKLHLNYVLSSVRAMSLGHQVKNFGWSIVWPSINYTCELS